MLQANSVLKELNVSHNHDAYVASASDGQGFVEGVSKGLTNNGTLTKLNMSDNKMACEEAGGALGELLRTNSVLKELNVSKNHDRWTDGANDGPGFGQGISKGLADNGTMSSLHVGSNGIPEKEMRKIMAIAMSKESMKILRAVPFKNKTITELDVSGKNLGVEGALVIAEYLDGNGALSVLSLKDNSLCNREAGKFLSEMLAVNTVLKVLDVSSNQSPANDFSARDGPGFAQELAVGLSDNGALSLLNLTDNCIGEAGVQKFKEMCGSRNISLLIN
jgi:Ran GTPase-activating protein (RanGAP) involved in mRNA processing and transport